MRLDKTSRILPVVKAHLAATALTLGLLAGCKIVFSPSFKGPDNYYINPDKSLSMLGNTVLVELNNNSTYPQISSDVTEALFQALQKRQLFSITVLQQSDPAWKSLEVETDSLYTVEQLGAMRKALRSNAVLLGTITTYRPYPHMSMGLKLRLVDLRDGQLLWAFEQVWDTTDKATEERIKSYFQTQMKAGFEPMGGELVTVSPLRFVKFIAYEVAQTM